MVNPYFLQKSLEKNWVKQKVKLELPSELLGVPVPSAVQYNWQIVKGKEYIGDGQNCRFTFPLYEGEYDVTLTVTYSDNSGTKKTSSTTQQVTVQDWLILSLGDSYASGEGNPDIRCPNTCIGGLSEILQIIKSIEGLEKTKNDLVNAFKIEESRIKPAKDALNNWNVKCIQAKTCPSGSSFNKITGFCERDTTKGESCTGGECTGGDCETVFGQQICTPRICVPKICVVLQDLYQLLVNAEQSPLALLNVVLPL